MANRKYSRDYRLIDSVDAQGRIRTETEYIGGRYRFSRGPERARAAIRRMGVYAGLGWLLFLLAVLPRSTASLTLYVTLPYLFTALPLWLLSSTLLRLWRAGDSLDRRTADQANDRLPACCLWLMVLPGLGLAGELIALTLRQGPFLAGDALFLAGAAGVGLCGWLCFRRRGGLCAERE